MARFFLKKNGLCVCDIGSTDLPTYRPTDLPTDLPTYLPTYRPTYLPTYRPTYLSTYLDENRTVESDVMSGL